MNVEVALESEICRYVRTRKNPRLAIRLATELYLLPKDTVVSILRRGGVLDANGSFMFAQQRTNQITEKEVSTMPRIKPGTFVWTSARVRTMSSLYQANTPIEMIAEKMGCTETQVYGAISKHNIVRVTMTTPQAPSTPSTEPTPVETPMEASADRHAELPTAIPAVAPTTVPVEEKTAETPTGWTVKALEELELFISLFEDGKTERAFISIGKLHAFLSEASGSCGKGRG